MPKCEFKIGFYNEKNQNCAKVYYLRGEPLNFIEFADGLNVLSDGTAGLFTIEHSDLHSIISYGATKQIRFTFYIALRQGNEWTFPLQGIYSKNGISLHSIQLPFQPLTSFVNLNTAFVVGLKPNSNELKVQLKTKTTTFTAALQNGGWQVGSTDNSPASNVEMDIDMLICHNCGRGHDISKCDWPYYAKNCSNCLVTSINGAGHSNPCNTINRITPLRSDILSINALPIFELVFTKAEVIGHFLIDGVFKQMNERTKLLSAPARSVISISDENGKRHISLRQNKIRRCCVLIAIKDKSQIWRLRFRAVVTKQDGLLVFPLQKTFSTVNNRFEIPEEYKLNTIAIIGLEPIQACFYALFNIFTTDPYNEFIGVDISGNRDVTEIGHILKPCNSITRKFDPILYEVELGSLGSFLDRRTQMADASR